MFVAYVPVLCNIHVRGGVMNGKVGGAYVCHTAIECVRSEFPLLYLRCLFRLCLTAQWLPVAQKPGSLFPALMLDVLEE